MLFIAIAPDEFNFGAFLFQKDRCYYGADQNQQNGHIQQIANSVLHNHAPSRNDLHENMITIQRNAPWVKNGFGEKTGEARFFGGSIWLLSEAEGNTKNLQMVWVI